MVALGVLTAGIGAVVQENAATADARAVADAFERGLRPVETTGTHRGRVSFAEGRLHTADRDLRVTGGGETRVVSVDALVYEGEGRRVTFLAGAIVRGTRPEAVMERRPPITASRGSGGVLVVGAPRLNASPVGLSGSAVTATLRTDVSHRRTDLGRGRYRVAVETETPRAWKRAFERLNATVVATDRDFDGDGVGSVVARFPGERVAYLVVHDMHLEVD